MTNFLIKTFIKNANADSRLRCGMLSSIIGIVCNILLFVLKFILGLVSGSISVSADAFNNLSDAGSSLVSLLGFKLASKPADKEHPFGHGRFEYLSGFIIAVIIMLVGFEFLKGAVDKIINPQPIVFNWIIVAGLVLSILVKIWLSLFHKKLGKLIDSKTIEASAADSLSDVLATSVTLVAIIGARFIDFPLDGYMGIIVALMVMYAGYKIACDTLSPLLGRAPDAELISAIKNEVLSYDGIIGIHDIIVHDYGPGRIFASLHAEVPADVDIMASHALIDCIEEETTNKLGVAVLIHMDPLDVNCPVTEKLRTMVAEVVCDIDNNFGIHDFRVIEGLGVVNLIFDLTVPIEDARSNAQINDVVCQKITDKDEKFRIKMTIDRTY